MSLEPDRAQIEIFVEAMFRYAGTDGYVSVRSFLADNATFRISTARLKGGLRHLIDIAEDDARRAANDPKQVVFCPPLAVFNGPDGWRARQEDLLKGLALSVECDQHPDEALNTLEDLLGPATLTVKSGGQWIDPDDTPRDKLHLHWRLSRPAMGDQLDRLKQVRRLAAAIVGADTSNVPTVHCLRWPGSWHRKNQPRLCEIVRASPDAEIDLDEALLKLEAAAPKTARGNGADSGSEAEAADWGELAARIVAGTYLHASLASLASKHARAGTPIGAAINQTRGLMEASAARIERPADWNIRFDDISRAFNSAYDKFAEPQRPEAAPPADSVQPINLWPSARAKLDDEQRESEPASSNNQPEKLTPIRFVRGEILPPREWIAHDGWIPTRKVTLLQGDGGEGKTPLVHQLQASCATALPWLGLRVEECASVGFYSEDEEQDIKERQAAIDASYCCACVETGNMHLFPRVGEDNELVVFDRGRRPSVTKFYRQVCEAASDYHARLVVLDVAVDLFGGNEISRVEVRAFFRPLFLLARNINGAVVMTAHVSQAGLRSDGGHSGSTDWSNAARTRLYLSRPKDDDSNEVDANARILTRKKANLASTGDTRKLRWKNGLIVPDGPSTPHYFRRSADEAFLALLDAVTTEGQKVSPKPRAGNYAPAFFMKRSPKERGDYQRADLERAMQRLLHSRDLTIVSYGPPSNDTQMIVRTDAAPDSEDGPL